MKATELYRFVVDYGGGSLWRDSIDLGHKGQYLDASIRKGSQPTVQTLADLCTLHGLRVALVDSGGEIVATVDPRSPGEGSEG